jgi:phosphatidylglycerophosphatase C
MMKAIAFFDFDGTISTKDSLADFIQYAVGKLNYYVGLLVLSPMLMAYILKFIPNDLAKEKLLSYFFKGWNVKQFQVLAERYSLEQIDEIIRPKAIEKIRWHQNQGHQVVIVSASMDYWLRPWCGKNDLCLIATRLEVKDSKLTGRFATKNCYGLEKANRVKDTFELSLYEYIYVYGDSDGDKELLALADECFYKPFRNA